MNKNLFWKILLSFCSLVSPQVQNPQAQTHTFAIVAHCSENTKFLSNGFTEKYILWVQSCTKHSKNFTKAKEMRKAEKN